MGTRHLICVVKNGEYKVAQYGQWDGQPSGQGSDILNFLKNEMNRVKFKNQIEALSFISKEELEQMWIESGKDPNEKLIPMEISSKFKELYPENSKDTGSGILQLIQDSNRQLKLDNSLNFANDSLSCRWGYVIDLDKNLFEVYEGANETPLNETESFILYKNNKTQSLSMIKPIILLNRLLVLIWMIYQQKKSFWKTLRIKMKTKKYSIIIIFSKDYWDVFEVIAESKEHAKQLARLDFPNARIGNISRT